VNAITITNISYTLWIKKFLRWKLKKQKKNKKTDGDWFECNHLVISHYIEGMHICY